MLFPTLAFGVFFLFVYFTAWSLDRENGRRKLFLLLASWFFYAQWDWRFVGLLIASAVLNWGVAALIARLATRARSGSWLVGLGVAANLLILGFFKYYGFFVEQAGDLLTRFGWERDLPLLQIVLPVGISFFTFQGISYVVDVHRGKTPVGAESLLDVMLLMSFFPHLVAGPIVRASDLLPQFDRTPRLTREMATHGLLLIVWGLFKKTVIASELSVRLVDPVFFDPSAYGGARPRWRRSMAMRSRSIATSRPIRTWRSGSRPCWAIPSRETSTSRIAPVRCRTSGGAGTSACRAG